MIYLWLKLTFSEHLHVLNLVSKATKELVKQQKSE